MASKATSARKTQKTANIPNGRRRRFPWARLWVWVGTAVAVGLMAALTVKLLY